MAQITKIYCICSIFLLLLQLGESSSAFLWGNETAFKNAQSSNSRGCLGLNLNHWIPTKHQKGKNGQGGLTPPEFCLLTTTTTTTKSEVIEL